MGEAAAERTAHPDRVMRDMPDHIRQQFAEWPGGGRAMNGGMPDACAD